MKWLKKLQQGLIRLVRGPGADGRAELYGDLAEALEKREDLLGFLQAEIRNCAIDKNNARAWVLRSMLARRVGRNEAADLPSYSNLMAGLIPEGDRMQIGAIDATADSREQAAGFRRLAAMTLMKKGLIGGVLGKLATPIFLIPITYVTALPSAQMISEVASQMPADAITGTKWLGLVMGNFIVDYGVAALVLFFGLIVLLMWLLPNGTGAWRLRFDRLPLVSMYREWAGADVAMALAALLQSKIDLNDALQQVGERSNAWTRWQISRVLQALTTGRSDDYIAAFSRGLFSPGMVARIATANRTANGISGALIEVGTKGVDRVVARMNRSADMLGAIVVAVTMTVTTILMAAQMQISSAIGEETPTSQSRAAK